MPAKKASVFTHGKKLSDESLYVINIIDLEPAGLLVKAYNQETNAEYFLSPSEGQLKEAALTRSEEDLTKLADSIDIYTKGDRTYISSSLPAIKDNKVIPAGPAVKEYIDNTVIGDVTLPELLTTALSELCKAKPAGLDAVRWLGEWLLENNPNQPHVEEP
mmetsp:Transcript_4461/g.8999  ORF Transcript_4461/g.8999 Transcript_4461/m.8999 type:complete len:161 (+) Transcript_4461:77-559(+)|eukprot:CAMPEP_0118662108 /NCGR_PEP_ID=MMETSP0785-20121206/16643_1 /TAXON_ID=91992 /ORGANISM="Bolidomonas pacifica, Strain CCMP 1866" /LENGTH=160 /DNA_ID=CAMNT_0006555605 /DNA_START=56 /DNA_END=538 /DNA_ORIENTATION=-